MTNRQIAALICKVLAFLIFLQAVQMVIFAGALGVYSQAAGKGHLVWMIFLMPIFVLWSSWYLWSKADIVSTRLIKNEIKLDHISQIQSIVFSAIGLLVLISGSLDIGKTYR